MADDPVRTDEARSWVVKAREDLRAAEHNLLADPPLLADTLFHCQPAVEKVLKGLLAWHDIPFRKTHSLVELGEACAKAVPGLEPLLRKAAPLTEYAWKFRYPGDLEEPSTSEAREALALAREVLETIRSRLPAEVCP